MTNVRTYILKSQQRVRQNYNKYKSLIPKSARYYPRITQLQVGEPKEFDLAICQIDISSSTKIAESLNDRRRWARLLSIFLTELTYVLIDHSGELDKYSGDGAMVIFGDGQEKPIAVRNAIEFCLTMFTLLGKSINPFLRTKNLPSIEIKAGIDYGDVIVQRIGTRHTNDLLIIGETANFAAKLEDLAESDELLIGHDVFTGLTDDRKDYCTECTNSKWNYDYAIYEYIGRWKLD